MTDKEVEWDGQTVANIDFNTIEPAFDEAKKTGGDDPTVWGDDEEKALVAKLVELNLKDDIAMLVLWPIQNSYRARLHDLSLLPIVKEEAPDISAIAPLAVAPGTGGRVRFTVTDRETEPGGCAFVVSSTNEQRLAASVEPAGGIEYDLVLDGAGRRRGRGRGCTGHRCRDRRQRTAREVDGRRDGGRGAAGGGRGRTDRPEPGRPQRAALAASSWTTQGLFSAAARLITSARCGAGGPAR